MKPKYYSINNILSKNAQYNLIIGERSNGKTYAVLEYIIRNFAEKGEQGAILRRWQDDFTGKRGQTMFDSLNANGVVSKYTGGEWSGVYYYSSRWFFCRYDDKGKREVCEIPFAYGFAITSMEHDKSTSYPNVTTILFDEFLTRGGYITDEFVLFINTCSTIIRDRDNVTIFMCGNTVNKYSPYFSEMGLTNIKNQKQGTIDVYQYGESDLLVAVEYCGAMKSGKKSDKYFAFSNPKLSMIKSGAWELDIYPHAPKKWTPSQILFTFFIKWDSDVLQCEIIESDGDVFIFIHRKTSELKNPDSDIVYSVEYDPRPNWRRKITKPTDNIDKRIANLFIKDKVFYQDNETGEIVRNYLEWSRK